jgi:hypothetical protein
MWYVRLGDDQPPRGGLLVTHKVRETDLRGEFDASLFVVDACFRRPLTCTLSHLPVLNRLSILGPALDPSMDSSYSNIPNL